MACNSSFGCFSQTQGCPSIDGCPPGICPDFVIRRHDTKPPFKLQVEDCDGPMDLTGLVVEASMWAKSKLKTTIAAEDTFISLANNIGFNQIAIGDIIVMDRVRSTEKMLVTSFDEVNYLINVQRGYSDTTAQDWKKGTSLKIMKFIDNDASAEMLYQDVLEIDGTTTSDVLINSFLIYDWLANDTCFPGCYYLEFKLIKMEDVQSQSIPLVEPLEPIVNFSAPIELPKFKEFDISAFKPLTFKPLTFKPLISDKHDQKLSTVKIQSVDSCATCNGQGFKEVDGIRKVCKTCSGTGKFKKDPFEQRNIELEAEMQRMQEEYKKNIIQMQEYIQTGAGSGNMNRNFHLNLGSGSGDVLPECSIGTGVEWVRRFPLNEGFLIQITDSPTQES